MCEAQRRRARGAAPAARARNDQPRLDARHRRRRRAPGRMSTSREGRSRRHRERRRRGARACRHDKAPRLQVWQRLHRRGVRRAARPADAEDVAVRGAAAGAVRFQSALDVPDAARPVHRRGHGTARRPGRALRRERGQQSAPHHRREPDSAGHAAAFLLARLRREGRLDALHRGAAPLALPDVPGHDRRRRRLRRAEPLANPRVHLGTTVPQPAAARVHRAGRHAGAARALGELPERGRRGAVGAAAVSGAARADADGRPGRGLPAHRRCDRARVPRPDVLSRHDGSRDGAHRRPAAVAPVLRELHADHRPHAGNPRRHRVARRDHARYVRRPDEPGHRRARAPAAAAAA